MKFCIRVEDYLSIFPKQQSISWNTQIIISSTCTGANTYFLTDTLRQRVLNFNKLWFRNLSMYSILLLYRSSRPEVFLGKGVLKICCKFKSATPILKCDFREHTCQNAISIKLKSKFIEITLGRGCSPVDLLHIFRTTFLKNASGRLLLDRSKILYIDKFLNHNLLKFKTLCLKVSLKKYVFAPVHGGWLLWMAASAYAS